MSPDTMTPQQDHATQPTAPAFRDPENRDGGGEANESPVGHPAGVDRAASVAAARASVREVMARLIVDAAACDEGDLRPEANFFYDLDGESIDLLDLSFRAEKTFAVKSPLSVWHKSDQWKTDQDGRLMAETIAWITTEFTRLQLSLPDFANVRMIKDICTVEFLIRLFEAAVREAEPA